MRPLSALTGGLAGAVAVTIIHESVKKVVPQAPRMDLLGMNAVRKGLHNLNWEQPSSSSLYAMTLAGDLVSNALYYSLAGIGKEKNIWVRASIIGLAAGLGGVLLPGPMGLPRKHSNRTVATQVMTVGLYLTGALVTAAVIKAMEKRRARKNRKWEHRLVTSAIS